MIRLYHINHPVFRDETTPKDHKCIWADKPQEICLWSEDELLYTLEDTEGGLLTVTYED